MNFVNGQFCHARKDFEDINPTNERVISSFPQSTKDEVAEAVAVARKTQNAWRSLSRINRAEYFDNLCAVIKNNKDELVKAISLETGKNRNESYAEVMEALHMTQYTFGMGRMPTGDIVSSEIAAKDSYVIRKPKGVVAVIAPWNFPLAISGFWCSAPSLLEGNTVVMKPSEDSPMVGQKIAKLYQEAGFPDGVFNVIHGNGEVGEMLAKENVDHICFTGSATVGKHIRKICADSWHKTCSCEMGSKSAVMVFADADYDLALSACIASAYKLSGQRCVSAGRMLIQRDIYDKFCHDFAAMSSKIKADDPFESDAYMGPIINKDQMFRVMLFNDEVHKDNKKILLDGGRQRRKGYFLDPFVYQSEWEDRNYLKNEVFGPSISLIPFDTVEDAARIYNDTGYGLSIAVCTNDYRKMRYMRDICDFGMMYVNGGTIGAESHLPFGGVKKSGIGGSSAAGTFRSVTNEVTVTINNGESIMWAQGLK